MRRKAGQRYCGDINIGSCIDTDHEAALLATDNKSQ